MRRGVLLMSLLTAGSFVPLAAAPRADGWVGIRTYNYANVSPEVLAAARAEAEQIFREAHIAIRWKDCRVAENAAGAACTEPIQAGRELLLRLVDRAPAIGAERSGTVALGESMLDGERREGVLMTVDLFPVRSVAAGTGADTATLLGRAIAHEVGHLLLGSSTHSGRGLMRALWSQDELRGRKPAHWGFSPQEAARMRHALRSRSRSAD